MLKVKLDGFVKNNIMLAPCQISGKVTGYTLQDPS